MISSRTYHDYAVISIVQYFEQFENLVNEVSGQSEESLISFSSGVLKLKLKNELKFTHQSTLRKAFALAKLHEAHKGT